METLAVVGRRSDAVVALERLRSEAAAADPGRWAAAAIARGDAAVADDPVEAVAHLDQAVALLTELGAGFELALAIVARGRAHAAAGSPIDAARDLADARARFEHLDARPWADRAAAAAALATGAGTPAAPPASSVAALLTDAELRVALAVSEGLTNREAADQLYLSIKTVDSHLQSIYRKLAIRSRSQLTARVAREGTPVRA